MGEPKIIMTTVGRIADGRWLAVFSADRTTHAVGWVALVDDDGQVSEWRPREGQPPFLPTLTGAWHGVIRNGGQVAERGEWPTRIRQAIRAELSASAGSVAARALDRDGAKAPPPANKMRHAPDGDPQVLNTAELATGQALHVIVDGYTVSVTHATDGDGRSYVSLGGVDCDLEGEMPGEYYVVPQGGRG